MKDVHQRSLLVAVVVRIDVSLAEVVAALDFIAEAIDVVIREGVGSEGSADIRVRLIQVP